MDRGGIMDEALLISTSWVYGDHGSRYTGIYDGKG